MIDERERCLELLGLKPGASAQEIKAAYRDLAKVWHPDRFAHDARLQEKAQNKLKEINEAYEALLTGTFKRTSNSPPRSASETRGPQSSPTSSSHNGSKYVLTAMSLIACLAVAAFFVAPKLLPKDTRATEQTSVTSQPVQDEEVSRDESAAAARKEKKTIEKQKAQAAAPASGTVEPSLPVRALPTATVTIDPTTGLLATSACPIKSSMTYVAGQEPRHYCSANHQASASSEAPTEAKKKSRLKSLGDHLSAPARWLKDKTQ
jgi:curved DNA-binding protein CbpA